MKVLARYSLGVARAGGVGALGGGVVGVVVVGVVVVGVVVVGAALLVVLDVVVLDVVVLGAEAALVAVETAPVRDPAEGPSATAAPANIASDTIVAAKAAVQEAKWRRIAGKVNQSTTRTRVGHPARRSAEVL
ncbi:MAG TPA: hypothetical protein VGG07_12175 [Solirubrobacteraceae bacterium]